MATLMEKDVLIELVAHTTAFIYRRVHLIDTPEIDFLANLRDKIYSSDAQDLDYKSIVHEVNTLKDKFKDLPLYAKR